VAPNADHCAPKRVPIRMRRFVVGCAATPRRIRGGVSDGRITTPAVRAGIVNRKKVQRLWREEGLRVPQPRRRKRVGSSTVADTSTTAAPNMVSAVDFQFDSTSDAGRSRSSRSSMSTPANASAA
jgi:hypothetical protein